MTITPNQNPFISPFHTYMFRSLVYQHPLYMVKLLNEFHKKNNSDNWIEHGKNFGKDKTRFFFPYRRGYSSNGKNSIRGAAAVLHLLCLQECLSAMFAWTCICVQTRLLREWLLQHDMWWTNPSITLFRQSCKVQDLQSKKKQKTAYLSTTKTQLSSPICGLGSLPIDPPPTNCDLWKRQPAEALTWVVFSSTD